MSIELSSENENLVLDNQRLVRYLVGKLGINPNSSEYEDIVSIGTIGLIKASISFDSSKKNTFATYASKCIINEILMHFRNEKKYANVISLDEPIANDSEGNELTFGDKLEHPDSDFLEELIIEQDFINLVSIILNYLEGKTRIVILYRIGEMSQPNIAKKLNISQSYVSRIKSNTINKIREAANQNVQYKEVFSMAIVGNEYRISFSSRDISKFNQIFASLLQNLTSTEKLPDFRVNCNRERIVIQIPAHPESFSFIAQIIQEIDDFSIAFVSDKNTFPVGNTAMQKVESDDANKKDTTVDTTKKTSESTVKGESQIKQVREYMLSISSFTVKDLKHHFPNLTNSSIQNAVYHAKSKGWITATSRGKYIVNKN